LAAPEAVFILDCYAADDCQKAYAGLSSEQQSQLRGRLAESNRKNTYAAVRIDRIRAEAFQANLAHYAEVFPQGREDYSSRLMGCSA
jgi:nitric oxide reductase subunit B